MRKPVLTKNITVKIRVCNLAVVIGNKHPKGDSEVFVLEIGKLPNLRRVSGVHRNVELFSSIDIGEGAAKETVKVPGVAIETSTLT